MNATTRGVLTLIRLRWQLLMRRMLTSYLREARRRALIQLVFSGLAGLVILGIFVFGLSTLLSFLLSGPHPRAQLGPVLGWGMTITSASIFFYAILAVLAVFTYSSDLELLLLTPISPRLILSDKFLTVTGGFFVLLLFLGAPVLLGVGHTLDLGLSYALATLLTLFLLPLAPVSLAMLLTLAILRWLPPARARAIVVISGIALFGISYLVVRFFTSAAHHLPAAVTNLNGWWQLVPLTWPGHFLAAVGQGHREEALVYLQATLASAGILSWLAVHLSAYMFGIGWAGYQEVGRRQRHLAEGPRILLPRRVGLTLPRQPESLGRPADSLRLLSIVLKELLILRRDPQLAGQIALPLVVTLFSFQRAFLGQSGVLSPYAGSLWLFGILAASSLFLLSFISLSIVNREGYSLYLLTLSPLTAREILMGKWAFCALPPMVVEAILAAVGSMSLRASMMATIVTTAVIAALVVALAGIMISAGLLWPRLHPDRARQPISFVGGVIGSAIGVLLSVCVIGTLIVAVADSGQAGQVDAIAAIAAFVLPCMAIAAVGAGTPRLLQRLLTSEARPG